MNNFRLHRQPIVGLDKAIKYCEVYPYEAIQPVTTLPMVLDLQHTEEYDADTFTPVFDPKKSSYGEAIVDLAEFLKKTGFEDSDFYRSCVTLPPGTYDEYYDLVKNDLSQHHRNSIVLTEEGPEHSSSFFAARCLEDLKDEGIGWIEMQDMDSLGDEEPRDFIYIDDWTVSGKQLTRLIEENIASHITNNDDTLTVYLMAANPAVVEDITKKYPWVRFNIASDVMVNEEVAGLGYNGSASWGYENIIGNIVLSNQDIEPPKAWHIVRPYKVAKYAKLGETSENQQRRQVMLNRIRTILNRHSVNPEKRQGEEQEIHFFTGEWGGLSNFAAYQIDIWEQSFSTSEHAYQWRKFKDSAPEVAEMVMKATSAVEAKKIADKYHLQADPQWDDLKAGVMREITLIKASKYPDIQKKLRRSGNRRIVEANPKDAFWGMGEDGKGLNMMGKIWEEMREKLRSGEIPPAEYDL